jgi:adenine-specific DNA-methyltransferase
MHDTASDPERAMCQEEFGLDCEAVIILCMRGFVPTPPELVDRMVAKLFAGLPPQSSNRLLDPGCGDGAFIEGVIRWCEENNSDTPLIEGVDLDPGLLTNALGRFRDRSQVKLLKLDYLTTELGSYDYVVANPPYVSISKLSEDEKRRYRQEFRSATGRFDLYFLFLEQSLRQLKPGGRLVYITPEKFLYVESARALRRLLASQRVLEVELVEEAAFAGFTTYPAISVIERRIQSKSGKGTVFRGRNGQSRKIRFNVSGDSLLPEMNGDVGGSYSGLTLGQVCERISAGVATGADAIFVKPTGSLDPGLRSFAYPTISGSQLVASESEIRTVESMLIPYDVQGQLQPFEALAEFAKYLNRGEVKCRLLERTCVRRKPWYAFHETPPLRDLLRPKILCKDISGKPRFWLDRTGVIVPRHTVYYMIPKTTVSIPRLMEYLHSKDAQEWLNHNCQRAANGYIRLQSSILKKLPLPSEMTPGEDEARPRLIQDSALDEYEPMYASLVGVA